MKKLSVLILILTVSVVSAYTLNGRKWFSNTSFHYNPAKTSACCLSSSEFESQVKAGPGPWSNIISFGSNTTLTGAKRNGVNVVSWAKLGGTTLAVTHYISTDSSQSQNCNGNTIYRFEEVDVRYNNKVNWRNSAGCSAGYDLRGVSVHEFGHAYGLGHTSVSAATMYPSVASCDFSKSSLETDDRSGYSAIYSGCN